jgi:hypothetical protein
VDAIKFLEAQGSTELDMSVDEFTAQLAALRVAQDLPAPHRPGSTDALKKLTKGETW